VCAVDITAAETAFVVPSVNVIVVSVAAQATTESKKRPLKRRRSNGC
jgi:hypothetical protein